MLWLGSLLFVLATVSGQSADSEASYMVTTPKKFWPNQRLEFTVLILKGSSPVDVAAELLSGRTTVASSPPVSVTPGTLTRLGFDVGDLDYGVYTLRVQGRGTTVNFVNETNVQYGTKSYSVFIQFDKPIYKPGQTVKFRVFSVNSDLIGRSISYKTEIFDGKGNKIKNYNLSPSTPGRVILDDSLKLSDQPVMGGWRLRITPEGSTDYEEKNFKVEEYVLPKFESMLELPSFHVLGNDDVVGRVGAKYTFGEDVSGPAKVEISRNGDRPFVINVNTNGMTEFRLTARQLRDMNLYLSASYRKTSLNIKATVTEQLTGNQHSTERSLIVAYRPYNIEFVSSMPKILRPGLQFSAIGKMTQPDGSPLPSGTSYTVISTARVGEMRTSSSVTKRLTVPPAVFYHDIDVSPNATNLNLELKVLTAEGHDDVSISKSIYTTFDSPSDNGVQVLLVDVGDTDLAFEIKTTEVVPTVFYQIMSRGRIVMEGGEAMNGLKTKEFTVSKLASMSPSPKITAFYVRGDGELIIDTIGFKLDGVLRNQVSLEYNKERVQPREAIELDVKAEPNSEVAILAVDKSVLLLATGNDITESDVIEALKEYEVGDKVNDGGVIMPMPGGIVFRRRRQALGRIWLPWYPSGTDAHTIISQTGLHVMTDALVFKKPKHKEEEIDMEFLPGVEGPAGPSDDGQSGRRDPVGTGDQGPQAPRTYFPESWLWTVYNSGSSGEESLQLVAPDTITSWVTTAFALHNTHGLGISAPASFETFREFFISMNLPYSLTRSEEADIQVNIFNYMSSAQTFTVTLDGSTEFDVMRSDNDLEFSSNVAASRTVRVNSNSAGSVYFSIKPTKVGSIKLAVTAVTGSKSDSVERYLPIKPEGTRVDFSYPTLVTLKTAGEHRFVQKLDIPSEAVSKSAYVKVQVIGDIMGPVLQGLDSLLMMPTGCGEQTMLTLAPNIYVMDYLEATGQNNADIKDKATGFMLSGYMRELTYRHSDGSFSAFGESDPSGSTWLTAFVAKCFKQATPYIVIDEEVIARALSFLRQHQENDGSFNEPGRVIHSDMQGDAADGIELTAYILIAMLEAGESASSNSVSLGLAKLESEIDRLSDPYPLALITYALTLADHRAADRAMNRLDTLKIESDGLIYWRRSEPTTEAPSTARRWHYPVPSADVEMTAYALMAYSKANRMEEGSRIVKWLTAQRNEMGGFSSTQNTVIGLQALSVFAAASRAGDFNVEVDARVDGRATHSFDAITSANSLVLQKWEVPDPDSVQEVDFVVQGAGVALVQVSGFYHIADVDGQDSRTSIKVYTRQSNDNSTLVLTVCASSPDDSMSMMQVSLLSGYTAQQPDVLSKGLRRVEIKDGVVSMYWDQFTSEGDGSCQTLVTRKEMEVRNLQPADAIAYSYYDPKQKARSLYQAAAQTCSNCGGGSTSSTTSSGSYLTSGVVSIVLLGSINFLIGCLLMC